MASNHWQEEPHVTKETHLPSIELNTLERQKYEKTTGGQSCIRPKLFKFFPGLFHIPQIANATPISFSNHKRHQSGEEVKITFKITTPNLSQ